MGVATVVALADLIAGADASLLYLLVVAPVLAATGAGARRTAVVAVYAAVLAALLGLANDFFLDTEHVVVLLTLAAGGALAIWIARLRDVRERGATRLAVQYGVAQTLFECETLEDAAPRLLRTIGEPLGWEVGALWLMEENGTLRCVESWHPPGVDPAGFAQASRAVSLRPGEGLPGRIWKREEPVWVEDVLTDDNFLRGEGAARAGLHAAIGFPIMAAGRTVGVVEFFLRRVQEPDRELIEFMRALGGRIGDFVESRRADRALRSSEARKSAVVEAALDCVITIDHEGRVLEFNPAAERTFGHRSEDAVGRELAELIVPPSLRDRHRDALDRYVRTGEGHLIGRRIELTGMRADGTEFPVELTITRVSGLSPPVMTGYIRDITERKRAEEERERLLALEQAARSDAVRAREQLQAILGGVADGVTAQAPDGTLLFANEAAVRTLGFSSNEELMAASPAQIMERFEVFDEEGRPFPLERLPGRLALSGAGPAEAVVRFKVRASGDERWSMVKATPVLGDGGSVAMAINIFEDITDHKRAEREQHFLSESSRVLASSLDPEETLGRVASLAVPDVADWVAVDLQGPLGSIERLAIAHADPALLEKGRRLAERYPPDPASPVGVPKVLRTGEPELYEEIPDELLSQATVDDEHLQLVREFGFRSAMLVPMAARGRTIGVLSFVSGPSGRRFGASDLRLATELARRCATAIDNARIYGERDYIARTLQESLLPVELPRIPGLETAARFHASGAGNEVGGDFYDLFQTGGQGWTVVVGDVCGKGPDAAAVTALARYTLRAAAMRERLPSRSLRILNEALLRQRGDRRFCTVAYAYLEAHNGGARVGVASGGHPLPLLLRAGGGVEPVGSHGTLLGVVPDPDLEDQSGALGPGDALVFYTDGVTEAGAPGAMLGEERLAELVASCQGLDADAIAGRVEAAALDAQGGRPRDDIAVVVVRVAG